MLSEHNIATLSDNNGKHNIEVEINKSGEGQNFVEMSMRDDRGKKISAFIPIKELYALTFSIVGDNEQTDLMPVRKTTLTTFRRKHIIEAKRNIKKGEKISFVSEINVPMAIEEGLQGVLGKKEASKAPNLMIPIN